MPRTHHAAHRKNSQNPNSPQDKELILCHSKQGLSRRELNAWKKLLPIAGLGSSHVRRGTMLQYHDSSCAMFFKSGLKAYEASRQIENAWYRFVINGHLRKVHAYKSIIRVFLSLHKCLAHLSSEHQVDIIKNESARAKTQPPIFLICSSFDRIFPTSSGATALPGW